MKILPICLLFVSNIFMSFAWYGHLKNTKSEVITLIVFSGFSILYLKQEFKLNYIYAFFCMIGAVYFMFKK